MNKVHRYFISFMYENGQKMDFGSVEIQTQTLITGMDDIRTIEFNLKSNHGDKVVILNWYKFDDIGIVQ